MITIEESYDLFTETLARLDNEKLKLSDKELEHEIFEELDADAHTFLHERTLDRLIKENKIPKDIKEWTLKLRLRIAELITETKSISDYRSLGTWDEVRAEANRIMNELKKR